MYTHLLQDIKSNTNVGTDVKDYADKIKVQNQLIEKLSNEPDLKTECFLQLHRGEVRDSMLYCWLKDGGILTARNVGSLRKLRVSSG